MRRALLAEPSLEDATWEWSFPSWRGSLIC